MIHCRAGRTHFSVLLALLGVLLGITPVSAQGAVEPVVAGLVTPDGPYDAGAINVRNVELLSHLPGGPRSLIRVRGDYAYALIGSNLEVYDISDPTHPVLTSTLPTGEFFFEPYRRDLIFMGEYAFLALESGLLTLDLSDPARPVIDEGIQLSRRWLAGITLAGEDLYVSASGESIQLMRVQPDGTQEEVGRYMVPGVFGFYAIMVEGDVGYLSLSVKVEDEQRFELHVLDLADPTRPQRLTTLEDAAGFWLQTTQERLYALNLSSSLDAYELIIFDRTTPQQPVEIGRYTARLEGDSIYLHVFPLVLEAWGGYVLHNLNQRLQILDLHDLQQPELIDTQIELPVFTLQDNLLYLLADGLHIYDLTTLPALDAIGAATLPFDGVESLHLRDGYAFVKAYDGLHVLDISTPFSPTQVAEHPLDTVIRFRNMLAVGDRLYGTDKESKPIINIADPHQPTLVGNGYASDATLHAVVGDKAYLLQTEEMEATSQLQIMDISAPDDWQLLGTLDLSGTASALAVQADRAYILLAGGETDGMAVVDVSDVAQPRLLDIFTQFWGSGLLRSTPGWLYLVDTANRHSASVQIIDISDPDNPVKVSTYQTSPNGDGPLTAATVSLPYLYLLDRNQGLYVVDITDPSLPLEAGRYHRIGDGYDIAVDDKVIGVAQGYGALSLYRFTPADETREVALTGLPTSLGGVRYTLPEALASSPISLTHAPRTLGTGVVYPSLLPTGIVFRIQAVNAASGEAVEPDGPFAITLDYAELDVPYALDKLVLMRWNGTTWQPLSMTTNPADQHDGAEGALASWAACRVK